MKSTWLLSIVLLLPISMFAQDMTIKSDNVQVEFIADMQKTKGTVSGFEAKINFNADDLSASSISGKVGVATLSTGNKKRDKHLKSDDYFHAEKYPNMTFKSSSITKEGNSYVMKGKLKIKDTEREEIITFTFIDHSFKGELTIQAANYKLGSFAKKKVEKTNVRITFVVPVQ